VPAANPWNPYGTRFYHPTGQPNSDGTSRLTGTPADVTMIGGLMLADEKLSSETKRQVAQMVM
jgi:hypothetical protein